MLSLSNKYRPSKFSDVYSHQFVVDVLKNSIELDKIGQAYLFTGLRGTGKTTLARIFAKVVNCLDRKDGEACGKCKNCKLIEENKNLDIIEIDAASNTGVDNIRDLKENLSVVPSTLKYKVYIIDEVHMLSKGAFNALLKSLEEPPDFVVFILATTEIHKVPATIISRCQRFDFKRIPNKEIVKKLKKIVKKERVKINDQALKEIAIAAEGGMRDAESLLSQIISLSGKEVTETEVREVLGVPEASNFKDLLSSIINKDTKQAFQVITKITYSGYDISNFTENFIAYLRNVLIYKIDSDYKETLLDEMTEDQFAFLDQLKEEISLAELGKLMAAMIEAKTMIKDSPLPQLPLEIAVVKLIEAEKKEPEPEIKAIPKKPEPRVIKKQKQTSNNNSDILKEIEDSLNGDSSEKQEKETKKNQAKKATKKPVRKKGSLKDDQEIHQKILENWPQIVEKIADFNRSLGGIMKGVNFLSYKNGFVVIEVKHNFHKAKLEEIETKRAMIKIFKDLLDQTVSFNYVIQAEKSEPISKKQPLQKTEDSLASELAEELGGEIIE